MRSAEGPADHYAGVTDRGAGPLLGAGGGSSSTAAAGRWLGGGGRRLGGLGGVEAPQLKYLAPRDRDRTTAEDCTRHPVLQASHKKESY